MKTLKLFRVIQNIGGYFHFISATEIYGYYPNTNSLFDTKRSIFIIFALRKNLIWYGTYYLTQEPPLGSKKRVN